MKATVSETTLISLSSTEPADLCASAHQLADHLTHGGRILSESLKLGSMLSGVVQGSAFCGAIDLTGGAEAAQVLISPEELSVSLTLRLLKEMQYEQ